ncbi:MAG: ATP synthase F1 subunit epsilon [Planctomycetia bacterium]|nr:ATP synthase F1 subunit epsilon [Planctomycetia bacterium]
MPQLKCIVVTPEQTVEDLPADFVALPLYDGELGVAPGHTPMIGRLGYGELRIVNAGQTTRYYVDGGFVEFADNIVSVLTNNAVPAKKLDAGKAQTQLEAAKSRPANTPELLAIRERDQQRARAQLRVARK